MNVFMYASNDYSSISRVCKSFNNLAKNSKFIAGIAAELTMQARSAKDAARQCVSEVVVAAEAVDNAQQIITFDVGTFRGKVWRGKAHGLGCYKSHRGPFYQYRGEWKNGNEHGFGHSSYKDSKGNISSYYGEFVNGERHGFGVYYYTDDCRNKCRYEGRWKMDKRCGAGLILGGLYRFLVGRYLLDQPIGIHMAFDYSMKDAVTLDMKWTRLDF